jgi:hypothetical protein
VPVPGLSTDFVVERPDQTGRGLARTRQVHGDNQRTADSPHQLRISCPALGVELELTFRALHPRQE